MSKRKVLLTSWIIFQLSLLFSNPTNPTIVSGMVDFGEVGNTLLISTASDRTIIEWDTFSIDAGETTQFAQPLSSSAVLNRVTSLNPTNILGNLTSNAQVFLLNPNGILVGSTGVVNVDMIVLSTLDVPDMEFLDGGDMTFSGSSTATIQNMGFVEGSLGVFLLGRHLINSGHVVALSSNAIFGAGVSILLRTSQKDIVINPQIETPTGTGIDHSGDILANRAELRADGNLYTLAIRHSGNTSALRTMNVDGEIFLVAEGGETRVQDQSSLLAHGSSGTGGHIQILGTTVTLQDQAEVTTRNDFGGGDIYIGGGPGGDDPDVFNATNTSIGSNVRIEADARIFGNAGDVSVFATDTAIFEGTILAHGGIAGGNGGTVEISGQLNLVLTGTVDTRAFINGLDGLLIIDPTNIIISNAATAGGAFDGGSPTNTFFPDFPGSPATAFLEDTDLQAALTLNNVEVRTSPSDAGSAGDITIDDAVALSVSTSRTLTLRADNDINIDSPFSFTDTGAGTSVLNLIATNNVNVSNDLTGSSLSAININADNNIDVTDDITLFTGTVNFTAGNDFLCSGGTPDITADQINFTITNDFTISSTTTFIGAGANSNITGTIGNDFLNTSTINFNNWGDINLSTTSGNITIDSGINCDSVTSLTLESGNDLINQGGTNTFNDLAGNVTDLFLNAVQDITINSQINIDDFNSATFNAGRDFVLNQDFEPDNTTTVTVNAVRDILNTGVAADILPVGITTLTFSAGNNFTSSEPFSVSNVDTILIEADNDIRFTTPNGQANVTGANTTLMAGNDIFIEDTFVSNAAGNITINAGNDLNVGPSDQASQIGSRLGNVIITTGRDLNVMGGTTGSDFAHIGFAATVVNSNIELTVGRNLNVSGGTANSTYGLIGHGFRVAGNYTGDIIIHSVGGDATLTGQPSVGGNTRFAQIGHARLGGSSASIFSGDIRGTSPGSPALITGTLTLQGGAGTTTTSYAHFGHGGGRNSNALDSYSGNIRVQANQIEILSGTANDNHASIGFFAVAQPGGVNPVIITGGVEVISNTTIDLIADTNGVTSIGSYVLNDADHPASVMLDFVDVQSGGDLTMISHAAVETDSMIGAFSTNPLSETNLSMDIGGTLSMESGAGASARITNGQGTTADLNMTIDVTEDILLAITGTFDSLIECVSGDLFVTAGGTVDLPAGSEIFNSGGSNGTMILTGGDFFFRDGGFAENQGTGTLEFRTTLGDVNLITGGFITSIGDMIGNVTRDIHLSENTSINSSGGSNDITAGGNITLTGGSGGPSFMSSSTGGTYTAGNTIFLQGVSAANEGYIENSTENLLVIAGLDVEVNFFGRIENLGDGSVTLVVDNSFPTPPGIGPGSFELSSFGSVGRLDAGPLRIFTAVRSQNLIEGINNLNGTTFVPGPLFIDSATEQWSTYFPSTFGGDPFTIFYKDGPITPIPPAPPFVPADLLAIDPNVFIPFYELFYLLDGYGIDPSVAWLPCTCIVDCQCPATILCTNPLARGGYSLDCCMKLPSYLRKLDLRPYYPR